MIDAHMDECRAIAMEHRNVTPDCSCEPCKRFRAGTQDRVEDAAAATAVRNKNAQPRAASRQSKQLERMGADARGYHDSDGGAAIENAYAGNQVSRQPMDTARSPSAGPAEHAPPRNSVAQLEERRRELQLRVDVMRLEAKLAGGGQKSSAPVAASTVSFADIESSLNVISGDDAADLCKWALDFEEAIQAFQLDQRTAMMFARRLLRGTARAWLPSIRL